MNKICSIKHLSEMNERDKKIFLIATDFGIESAEYLWINSFKYFIEKFKDENCFIRLYGFW